jgi:fructoselysine-6-P-deglycase FrlB-like protein
MQKHTFVGCGELILDKIYRKDPELKLVKQAGGGTVWNILANLAKHNEKTIAFGICGKDKESDAAINSLNELGVDTSYIKKAKKRTNIVSMIIPDGEPNDDSVIRSAISPVTNKNTITYSNNMHQLLPKELEGKRPVCIFENIMKPNFKLIKSLDSAKAILALDIGHRGLVRGLPSRYILECLVRFKFMQTSQKVVPVLCGKLGVKNEEELFKKLALDILIITKASDGAKCLWRLGNRVYVFEHKPIAQTIVDSTGAGDAFFSIMLKEYAHLKMHDKPMTKKWIAKSLELANNYASHAIKFVGARGHLYENSDTRRMDYNLDKLYERISDAHQLGAYSRLESVLNKISGNILVVGTGGSYVVANYAKKVIESKTDCLAICHRPRDAFFERLDRIDHVFAFTYSGSTPEIVKLVKECKKYPNINSINIVTRAEEKTIRKKYELQSNDCVISYLSDTPKERSYISIAATMIPITLFARYECGIDKKEFLGFIEKLIKKEETRVYSDNDFNKTGINVVYGYESVASAILLESNLIEAGITHVVVHEKKDFGHGRVSILDKSKNVVYLISGQKDRYDNTLIKYLNLYNDINVAFMKSRQFGLLGELELLVKTMYFSRNLARAAGVDLSRIAYLKEIKKIYSYNGRLT